MTGSGQNNEKRKTVAGTGNIRESFARNFIRNILHYKHPFIYLATHCLVV